MINTVFQLFTSLDVASGQNPLVDTVPGFPTGELITVEKLITGLDPNTNYISWDSQADRTYHIFSSTDLGNWTVAIDAIEGTGERLTRCFIRQESKIYYRVKESK